MIDKSEISVTFDSSYSIPTRKNLRDRKKRYLIINSSLKIWLYSYIIIEIKHLENLSFIITTPKTLIYNTIRYIRKNFDQNNKFKT